MLIRATKLIKTLPAGTAALVHTPDNIAYLSGFTGEGALFVTNGCCAIVTDFRYSEQAERQAPGWRIVMDTLQHTEDECLFELCKENECRNVLCETDHLTVKNYRALQITMAGITFAEMGSRIAELREVKDPDEIELLAKAENITCDAFDDILGILKPGMSEKEIALELYIAMTRHGGEGLSFPSIVAANVNGSLCHAIPTDYRIQTGDMLTMDFGAIYKGYCGDFTRTVAIGQPNPKLAEIYQIVLDAQLAACDALQAGRTGKEIDGVARDIIAQAGYGDCFGHGLGHGIGRLCHEPPRLNLVWDKPLKAGVVVSVEPGIYVPGLGGVRIEDICVVEENGNRNLTRSEKRLIIL